MGSLLTEGAQQLNTEENPRMESAKLILSSPDPPSLFQELIASIKDAVFPQKSKLSSSSSSAKQPRSKTAILFLEGLFPILSWGRNYQASKFKNDLMAGLTLASLCIPQVMHNK